MAKEKIVVVEDDKEILRDIVVLLEEENYLVFPAKNGNEGIELIKKELPSLILCDLLMPDLDGYQVLKKIQKDKLTRNIPFIFVTAKVERQDVRKGMQLGADDYIFKPFTADTLLNSIRTRIEKRNTLIAELENPKTNSEKIRHNKRKESIVVKIDGVPRIILIADIVFISAEKKYTSLSFADGNRMLVRKSINSWVETLPVTKFLLIHRGILINTEYLLKMEKWHNSSYLIYLRGINEPFSISKRYAARLEQNRI